MIQPLEGSLHLAQDKKLQRKDEIEFVLVVLENKILLHIHSAEYLLIGFPLAAKTPIHAGYVALLLLVANENKALPTHTVVAKVMEASQYNHNVGPLAIHLN